MATLDDMDLALARIWEMQAESEDGFVNQSDVQAELKEVNPKHISSYIAALVRDGFLHSISVADGSKNLFTSRLSVTVKGVDRLKEGGSRTSQR